MRILILAGVAAAALTLTACNREEPAEPTADEAAATAETGTMSAGGSSNTGGAMASGSTNTGADTPVSSEGSMPATEPVEAPVSEATREGAKAKAESTNLHPSGQ